MPPRLFVETVLRHFGCSVMSVLVPLPQKLDGAQLLVPFRHECCNALVGLLNKLIGDLLDVFSSTIEVGEMGPANNAQQPVRILLGVRFNKIRLVADE